MQRPHLSSSKTFSSPQGDPTSVSGHVPSPHFPALPTTNVLSVSMDLSVLDISYKQNHTICGLLCLASLTEHVFEVYLCHSMDQYLILFFRCTNNSFLNWSIVDLLCDSFWCTAKWFSYIYMCVCVRIHMHFFRFFSIIDNDKILSIFLCAIQQLPWMNFMNFPAVVQWLRLCVSTAGDEGSIPG